MDIKVVAWVVTLLLRTAALVTGMARLLQLSVNVTTPGVMAAVDTADRRPNACGIEVKGGSQSEANCLPSACMV